MPDPLHPLFAKLGFHTLWHHSHPKRDRPMMVGRPAEETTAKGAGVHEISLTKGSMPHAELGSKLVDAKTHPGGHPNVSRPYVRHSRN